MNFRPLEQLDGSCMYCGLTHSTVCQRIKKLEYFEDGVTIKSVELHQPQPTYDGPKLYADGGRRSADDVLYPFPR